MYACCLVSKRPCTGTCRIHICHGPTAMCVCMDACMVGFWDGALAIGYKQLHGSVIAVPVHAVSLLWPHLKMGGTQPARPPPAGTLWFSLSSLHEWMDAWAHKIQTKSKLDSSLSFWLCVYVGTTYTC